MLLEGLCFLLSHLAMDRGKAIVPETGQIDAKGPAGAWAKTAQKALQSLHSDVKHQRGSSAVIIHCRADMEGVPYAEGVGAAMWIAMCTRPDAAHAVSRLAKYMANPGRAHWEALKRLARYLVTTRDVGIVYDESEYDVGLLPAMLSYEPPPGAPPSPPNCALLLGPEEEGEVWKAFALAFAFGGALRVAVCAGGCEGGC